MTLLGMEKLSTLLLNEGQPCGVRLLGRVKAAEVDFLPVYRRASNEFGTITTQSHATREISFPKAAVPQVLLLSSLTEIVPAVVSAIAVFVIDLFRPRSHLHDPDHAMGQIVGLIDRHEDISTMADGARFLPCKTSIPCCVSVSILKVAQWARFPRQVAGIRIIRQALTEVFCSVERLRLHRQSFVMEMVR